MDEIKQLVISSCVWGAILRDMAKASGVSLDHTETHKLLYLVYAMHLTENVAICEPACAWPSGPVFAALWGYLKSGDEIDSAVINAALKHTLVIEIMQDVLKEYIAGGRNISRLRALLASKGSPWERRITEDGPIPVYGRDIPHESVRHWALLGMPKTGKSEYMI